MRSMAYTSQRSASRAAVGAARPTGGGSSLAVGSTPSNAKVRSRADKSGLKPDQKSRVLPFRDLGPESRRISSIVQGQV